jgi:hypothetical protein
MRRVGQLNQAVSASRVAGFDFRPLQTGKLLPERHGSMRQRLSGWVRETTSMKVMLAHFVVDATRCDAE